ncbi:ribonuclease P protein component [Aureimonas leprariae]|uniref:Ribonuclease P protein component n=1 Tax=Plantimonas leprariae TaxID=2615207 RepID=A0A7V7PQH5_9HYPH|nr:ribonuclease P protein component [Aureimonas leprariae]
MARLRRRADFLAARRGRRLGGPFFFIEALDRHDGAEPRFGLTVTRKVGNAVERNRIRRRLREAIRTSCGADMARGFDYVIVARREVLDLAFERLRSELHRRLSKVRPAQDAAGMAAGEDAPQDGMAPPRGRAGV